MGTHVQPTRSVADILGARLAYEVAGNGQPLVLIHARIADSRMWDPNWTDLAAHCTVIRYDLRGHGASTMPAGPFSHVADLAALLALLNIAPVALIGSSMGGEIALDFALQYPEQVTALVPVACAPTGYPWSADLDPLWTAIFAALERGDVADAVERELQLWVDGPQRRPEHVDRTVRERLRVMDTAYWQAFAAYRAFAQPVPPPEPRTSTRLAEIGVPTLVVVGSADVPDIHRSTDLLAATIPTATKVVVDGAGHMLTMEQPQRFTQLVQQFLGL